MSPNQDYKLELVGAETPSVAPAKYEITPNERLLFVIAYEAERVLQYPRLGAPDKRNARAGLVAAVRLALSTGVTLKEFLDGSKEEWRFAKESKSK